MAQISITELVFLPRFKAWPSHTESVPESSFHLGGCKPGRLSALWSGWNRSVTNMLVLSYLQSAWGHQSGMRKWELQTARFPSHIFFWPAQVTFFSGRQADAPSLEATAWCPSPEEGMRASSGSTREFCLYPQGQERVLQVNDKGTTSKHEKPKLHLHEATHRRSKRRATERHQIGHQSLHVPPATSGGVNHSQDSIPSIPRPYPPRLDSRPPFAKSKRWKNLL